MKILFLSFVPLPLPDESPTSAIQRTARANGFKNCLGLLSYISKATTQNVGGYLLLDNSAISRSLQGCLPEHADRIKAIFYQSTHPLLKRPNALISGVKVSYSNLRWVDSALCTDCLKEEYERFPKDIKLFSNCPFHNRVFLFRCPTCSTKINWKLQLTAYCECGERLVSPNVSNSDMTLDHYLLSLFQKSDAEKIASIQRILATLEHETLTTDEEVRSARRALAIAISCHDVESMADQIHHCLPCSSVEEINAIFAIIKNELSESIRTTLRQRLISTIYEQKDPLAKITFSVEKLQDYIGMSRGTWYNLKYRNSFFKGIGRGAKISLEDAISLKKTLASDKTVDRDPDRKTQKPGHRQIFSPSAVEYFTDLPEKTVKTLALNTNLMGLKNRHIKQNKLGLELLIGRHCIDRFNQYYVCSHRLARIWDTPISTINDAIEAYHFRQKKYALIQDTVIIQKSLMLRLFAVVKNSQPCPSKPKKRLHVTCRLLSRNADFLTVPACAKLLSISKNETSRLIRERIISCYCKGSHGRYLISKNDALQFNNDYIRIQELSKQLNIAPQKVSSTLSSAGILPISGPLVNSGAILLYKRSSIPIATINSLKIYRNTTEKRPDHKTSTRDWRLEFCININTICKENSMSKPSFYHRFLANGLIPHKKCKSDKFITAEGKAKVLQILNKHISYEDAATILNVPRGFFLRLISKNKATSGDTLIREIKIPGMLSRKQLDALRSKLSSHARPLHP